MSEHRVLVIANPTDLRVDLGRIRIDRDGQEAVFVLPADIAVLILESKLSTLSVAVMAALAESQAMVMVCDDRHMPIALQMPLTTNFVSVGRLRLQIAFDTTEARSRAWQQLVANKIANSAIALRHLGRNGALRLERMATEVQAGDPNNLEAQAAKHYWQNLFPTGFKRSKQGADDPVNLRLNYGYAVLRAMVARSLVAAGLNCALGVGHYQSGNQFNLADDFIESYRFLVDIAVAQWADKNQILSENPPQAAEFIGIEKRALLEFVKTTVRIQDQDMRLNTAIDLSVTSFVNLIQGKVTTLQLPIGFT